jgi:hypothetical protein
MGDEGMERDEAQLSWLEPLWAPDVDYLSPAMADELEQAAEALELQARELRAMAARLRE